MLENTIGDVLKYIKIACAYMHGILLFPITASKTGTTFQVHFHDPDERIPTIPMPMDAPL